MTLLLLACVGLQAVPQGTHPGRTGQDPHETGGGSALDSASDGNSEPIADAGGDGAGKVGVVANFDGSGSYDPDGDGLDFTWTLESAPSGSHVKLSSADQEVAQLVPDLDGTYRIGLVVSDGALDSEQDIATLSVTSGNGAPVASAGVDQSVTVGDTVMLDGSGSKDPDSDPLQYTWTLATRPAGSAAVLSSTTAMRPSFTTDVAGQYEASLTVSDGTKTSAADNVRVVASSSGGGGGGSSSSCGCQASDSAGLGALVGALALVGRWRARRG